MLSSIENTLEESQGGKDYFPYYSKAHYRSIEIKTM